MLLMLGKQVPRKWPSLHICNLIWILISPCLHFYKKWWLQMFMCLNKGSFFGIHDCFITPELSSRALQNHSCVSWRMSRTYFQSFLEACLRGTKLQWVVDRLLHCLYMTMLHFLHSVLVIFVWKLWQNCSNQ